MAEVTNPFKEPQDGSTLETDLPDVDKLTPEALSDEPSADDSVEVEDTGGGTPLHGLLLKMAKDDKGLRRELDLDQLSRMLGDETQVNAKNANGETALHIAAANGLVEAATRLIDAHANLSELDNEEQQPLHKACSGGSVDIVNLLLKNGANTQIAEEDGWSPLHFASRCGHTEVIKALLTEDNTNIDATESLEGWTALHLAIYNGHGDAASALLKEGANVGIQDNDGWTPLMTATNKKHDKIVEELLNQNGDLEVDTSNKSGLTPLLVASIHGFLAGARLLIKAGADCNVQSTSSKSTPLISASCWGYRGIVQALLEPSGRTNINIQEEDGWAAIHFASQRGHSKVVMLLLQHQANVELVNDDRQTALHMASKNGNEDVVKLLLDAGANVDAADKDGETALHLASGAGPEDRSQQHDDEIGTDALGTIEREMEESRSGQHAAVVGLLLRYGAKPDAKTNKNETALHLAAPHEDPARLELILASLELEHMDDEIKLAVNDSETHSIAKRLMKERLKRKERAMPTGSDNWGVIEWAAYSQLPEVLSPLIAKSPGSMDLEAALKSALESTLQSTLDSFDGLREDAEQSKPHEVLSLLVNNTPRTPDIKEKLKSALKKTLKLALEKKVKEEAGHRQLLQLLTLLIATFSGTTEIETELKSTLQLVETPQKEVKYEQLSQVLWLLIANSSRTPEIDTALKSALDSASKLANTREDQPQDIDLRPKLSRSARVELRESSQKGKNKDPGTPIELRRGEPATKSTAPTTRAAKDPQINYLDVIKDILRAPPFSQTHKDSRIDGLPKHNLQLSDILNDFEAAVVQFYKSEGESGAFRRHRSLKEVIYDDGPGKIMKKTISHLREILGGRSELADSIIYLKTEPKFTWVHLPATNMVWMNDILMRIMNDEGCEARPYHELKSFFRDSWTQVPDRTSSSRSMRPRTVVRRQENETDGKNDNKKEEEERSDEKEKEGGKGEKTRKEEKEAERVGEKSKGEESGKAKKEAGSEKDRQKKNDPDFGAASATYMPYFCFSAQYRDEASLGEKQKKFNKMKKAYEDLKDSKIPVIHESPTLDEWYYQFATDEKSTKDRESRNRTQVVTKAIEGRKSTEDVDKSTKENDEWTEEGEKNQPSEWTLLRVNQLWVWTIANKWLITATSCLFDDSHDTLVEGILDQLGKEAEAGGSASQPESADDMSRFIVDYCIGSYERLPKSQEPKPQGRASIRQIFSNTINEIGRGEAALFEEFRNQTERWREQIPSELKRTKKGAPSPSDESSPEGSLKGSTIVSSDETSDALSQVSTYGDIRVAIKKAERMYCEIKDIRDELNILKSAAQHQKTVEAGLDKGSLDVDLAAAYIVNDLKEMDNSAERIQSAINTTLSLLQSENANLQATLSLRQSKLSNHLAELTREQGEEAERQGKVLMVFTIVTILFLPLSFLSSLFALDVASFQQAPGWAFAVIFAVSFAFSAVTALVAQRWDKISPHMRELRKFILRAWKSIKTGWRSSKEERIPEPPLEPTPGEVGSLKPPLLSSLRGRLTRRQSDAV
ncbi:hypothetical protein CEP54_013846 [Fusarium duplospermum]|uniref:Uncharacterized protein n=1 Tax=Fusarium duplospermum TaxID=1325734 RepID=A0A428P035_9HYPO|nr:hypothetical protein CEP54_013846 [Fusarium duplospermum]